MPFELANLLFRQIRSAEEESGRIYDAVIGIVTNLADPQKLCRVRVKFPSLGIVDESWWATVVAPGAGKDRGWHSLPEVDDEVLCVFEHGDVARPVVIGALWNGKDKPPDANDGDNERRTIVSKGGNKIVFDDKAKTITLQDGGGVGSIELAETGITFTAKQGDVALQGQGDVSIVAAEISIKGTTVDLMGKAGVNMSSTGAFTIKGSLVALKGATIDLNPGGVPKAAKADGAVSGDGEDPGKNGGGGGGGPGGGAPGGGGGPRPGGNKPAPDDPIVDLHTVEIKVVNALDQPSAGVFYELRLPDGASRSGTTDADGMIRVTGIERAGDCTVSFPGVDAQLPDDEPAPPPAPAAP